MALVWPFAGLVLHAGRPITSGFVVHPSGLIATCWHVVEGRNDVSFALLDEEHAFPVQLACQPDLQHDLVLLRPAPHVRLPPLPAARLIGSDSAHPGDSFAAQGFGEIEDSFHDYRFLAATGHIVGPMQRDGVIYLQVESRQVLRGMSGAGIVLGSDEGVIGVLTERYNPPSEQTWLRDTAWIVPAEHVAALAPELLTVVPLRRRRSGRDAAVSAIWQTRGLRPAAVFAGRDTALARLNRHLVPGEGGTMAITGIGGCGKTRLALEYASRRAPEYDVVWLVRAGFLDADMRELATALALPTPPDGDVVSILHGWLASHSRWLIIIDGVDDPHQDADRYPTGRGHVLITSRNTEWGNIATPVHIGRLERAESVRFLSRRGLTAAQEELAALANEVGDLPLALEQAASFVLATGQTVPNYLALLREHTAELLEATEAPDYPMAITATWALSFDRLRTECPAAMEMLRFASFMATDDIPLSVFHAAVGEMPRRFRRHLREPLDLARTVRHLTRYSLAELGTDAINVHTLVQTVVREVSLNAAQRADYCDRVTRVLRAEYPQRSEDVDQWATCARLTTHGIAVAGHAEALGSGRDEASDLLDRVATYIEGRVGARTAVPLFQKAVQMAESTLAEHSSALATRLNNLGSALFSADRLDEAIELFERVLAIDEFRARRHREAIPVEHLMNYGVATYFAGDRPRGVALMERAVRDASPSDPFFGVMLLNLASERRSQRDFDRAENLARTVEEATRARFGRMHPYYAAALSELGRIAADQGDIEKAVDLLRQAARTMLDRFGPAATQTIETHVKYLDALTNNEADDRAVELADWMRANLDLSGPPRSAQPAFETTAAFSPPDALAKIGIIYLHFDRAEDALHCFEEAAGAVEEFTESESPALAVHENNIGSALLALHRVREAKHALTLALDLATDDDTLTPIYLANRAIAAGQERDFRGLDHYIDLALAAQDRHQTDRPYVLQKLACAETAAGRYDAARARLYEAMSTLETVEVSSARRQVLSRMLDDLNRSLPPAS
ncbi:FxSxx-COOH system tetratricopeptide repeat protein [Actinomadura sp. WMMA1423]|uniref:FxSxx-COOH system tetratricopeptide repeat protein n=1 Tax=Actinomadura sp. WMMA1423 TaxID=2591108 RepID=UPI0011465F25|nr:FxSxx-COOH system tetratricopeptide repeat protein [Actinomadura sp. WMMA1423]